METLFFFTAFIAYTVGTFLYVSYVFTRNERLTTVGRRLIVAAVAAHFVSLLIRTYIGRQMPDHGWYAPWSNWFESFSFFALVIATQFLIIQRRSSMPILGAFVLPLAWISLVTALTSSTGRQIPALPPALQSHWMLIHVSLMFVAYAAFGFAFAIGIAYILQERQIKSKKPGDVAFRLPPLDELDALIFRVILFALPVLTLGLGVGAIWAHEAWGKYWSWDAKQTWAFITWLIYVFYIAVRLGGWRGRKSAYLSLIGFAVMLFTYVGVNFISQQHGFISGGH